MPAAISNAMHPNRWVKRGSQWICGKCDREEITEPAHLLGSVPRCCNHDMKYLGGRFRWAADEPLSFSKRGECDDDGKND